jgi:hypothetical protein
MGLPNFIEVSSSGKNKEGSWIITRIGRSPGAIS